ncbi:hypothetical protein [Blastococcus sp. TF02A-35]|uniref:hypothetical protein n=1 Tax=Blastococcus sp. TF02A-35 TaxID=2559612 RepID=UPI001073D5E2|nr:hypothetical protein [Blastococcus sp. TF02A_35]TFV53413.1 hypothetical protein E4P43_02435 [Blastococcus sp. TF02A_35]
MRRAALLVGALLLAGCAGRPGDAPAPADAGAALPTVPGVEAEAVLLRTDEAAGDRFQVRVTAGAPFTVTAVALEVPGFAPLPAAAVTAELVPGRVVDLPVTYGGVDCSVTPGAAAVRLTVRRPDGAVDEPLVPLQGDVPARVHAEECAAVRLAAAVEVAVTGLRPAEDSVSGRLALRRLAGGEPVTVVRIGRSVLVEVWADLPLRMGVRDDAADVPVTFRPATCEPHVLAETKQPYVFPVELLQGEEAPVVVDLPVDDDLRAALADLVRRVCGAG